MKNTNTYYQEKWDALEAEINRKGANGAAFVEAMQDLYSVYDDEQIIWLAKLYDPKIGGFYFSNTARDYEYIHYNGNAYQLLPDIESTNQATNFLQSNYLIKDFSELPEKMRQQMYNFMCERLDHENGFFYHPQWPKEMTDAKPHRRGRDLMWAEDMANKFGWKYPYPTANERLANMKNDKDATAEIPEYLKSKEALLEFLSEMDWENNPYISGNRLASQAYPIRSAGLADVAIQFMNSIQNPETGLWGKYDGYEAVNGFMKISCFYDTVKRPVPNADKAAVTMMKSLISDEPVETVCYQYNGWFAIRNILTSLRTFGGDEGNKHADEIVVTLLKMAPEAIRATKKKVLIFQKKDHTFSFTPKWTSGTSQGMPVGVFYTNEGDVNANGICTGGTVNNLYKALELFDFAVPIFSPDGYSKFLANLRLD